MLMGSSEEEKEGIVIEDENTVNEQEQFTVTEEALVSMHATSNNPDLKTMKLKGSFGDKPVYALLDSGSIIAS
jgi:hypothetical protein